MQQHPKDQQPNDENVNDEQVDEQVDDEQVDEEQVDEEQVDEEQSSKIRTSRRLKMDRVILALLEHGRVEAAATALGVSSVTVYRVMKTPTFEAEFREARRNAFSRWITRLQHAAPAAVAVLFQIMADRGAPPAIRVRAAEIVLDHAASTFVLEDLDVRLDRLERADEKPPSESNMLEDAGDGTESKK